MGDANDELRAILTGLLPEPLAHAYTALLADPGREPRLHEDGSLDSELVARGLAYVGSHRRPPVLMPAEPLTALAGALAQYQRRLAAQHERLIDGYTALAELQRRTEQEQRENSPSALVRVLTDRDEISELSRTLVGEARQDAMEIESLNYDLPLSETAALSPVPSLVERGVRCRGIYETAFLSNPVTERTLRLCIADGMQIRTLPRLPAKMKIADEHAALVALTSTGMGGALLVRSTVLLGALRQYFELLWARATPVAADDHDAGGLGPRDREVLTLLAHGLKDEAIARRLGLSLRTVRRCVTTILDHLQVTTRFAAGAAAQRQGLLD